MDFWDYLVDNEGFPGDSQYLLSEPASVSTALDLKIANL